MTDIKLPQETLVETYGFHRTAEGRAFLREVYKTYLSLAGTPKSGKVALIVADSKDSEEVDLTRSALKRWEEGKGALWEKQSEKTDRVMERLERLMVTHAGIAEILSDRAADIHKRDVGSALEILIYGAKPFGDLSRIEADFTELEGLFETEQSSWGSNRYTIEFYTYYKRPPGCRFLLVHEISVDSRHTAYPIVGRRRSGYAFPTGREEIYRFMIEHNNPGQRVFEVLSERGRYVDEAYRVVYQRAPHYADLNITVEGDESDRKILVNTRCQNRFIENYIENQLWDIVR